MGAVEFLASLGRYPRLPRPTAQMSAVEKSLLLVGAAGETAALLHGKLPVPAWVAEAGMHGQVIEHQRTLYDQISGAADAILQGIQRAEDPRLSVSAHVYYDALWSAYLGAQHGVTPLAQALAKNETGHDAEFESRLGVLQAVADQLRSDMPLLQKGVSAALSTGIDSMWKSVCAAPGNKNHPECLKRGLGLEPVTIGIIIAISVSIIIAITYCLLKMYEVRKFNERWIARCTREDLDEGTLKWCNQTGGPPPAWDPNAFAKTVAWIVGLGIGAYAVVSFLPQIVGKVGAARRTAREA